MNSLLQVGDQFLSIKTACDAIKQYTLDDSKLYVIVASDKKQYIIGCKAASTGCKFEFKQLDLQKELYLSLFLFLILVVLQHTITTHSQTLFGILRTITTP